MVQTNLTNCNVFDSKILHDIACNIGWSTERLSYILADIPNYLKFCYEVAQNYSHDNTTQVGSCLVDSIGTVISTGYNGFIKYDGLATDARLHPNADKPNKYMWFEHAERRAIFEAMKYPIKVSNLVMFCPYFSCADCSRAICLSGIKLVIGHKTPLSKYPERWKESIEVGRKMFDDYGVMYYEYEGVVGSTMLINGTEIQV